MQRRPLVGARDRALLAGVVVCSALLAGALGQTGDENPPAALRILSEQEVAATPSVATGVRWASGSSVYLTRLADGVFEVPLEGKLTPTRVLVPDQQTMHMRFASFSKLAASSDYVAASASLADFIFRPVRTQPGGIFRLTKLRVGIAYAFDISGDRLLFLGDLVPNTEEQDSRAVVWIGPLTAHPRQDLKPILSDAASAAATTPSTPSLINCAELQLGAARFLPDGSFLVVPGFQPGIHLYSPNAELLHTWQNDAVGLDAPDCAGMSPKDEERYRLSFLARFEFINQHRVLDDILPLPQGPGLLIRYLADGKVHWVLKVLQPDGTTLTYSLPFTGTVSSDRLRGDVRGDRIVLLRVGYGAKKGAANPSGHLYVAQLPQGAGETTR